TASAADPHREIFSLRRGCNARLTESSAENLSANTAITSQCFRSQSRLARAVQPGDAFALPIRPIAIVRQCCTRGRRVCVQRCISAGVYLRLRRDFFAAGPLRAPADLLMANSSILWPSLTSAVSH